MSSNELWLPASRWDRLQAHSLDVFGWAAPVSGMTWSAHRVDRHWHLMIAEPIFFGSLLALLGIFALQSTMVLLRRRSLGKAAFGLWVVDEEGRPPTLVRYVFLRILPVLLMHAIPFVGWIAGILDGVLIFGEQQRCLHDVVAGTRVVQRVRSL